MNEMQDRIEIANRLKTIRTAKGISQEKMAEEIGLAYVTYTKLENGAHNLTTKNVKKASKILGVTTDLLLFGNTGTDKFNFDEYIRCAKLFCPSNLDALAGAMELIKRLQSEKM